MRKNLLTLIILSVVLYSCGNSFGGFDPRAYNSKAALDVEQPEEDSVAPTPVPEGSDPFLELENTNPNEGFEATKFDTWSFRVTDINGDNVPSYKFETDRTWASLDTFKGEYSHSGGNIGSGVKEIGGVKYYKYESKNPIFKADSSYNTGYHGTRMERFYFYRFTGNATLNTKLDNYIIAVDTYKKLIFAYAVPTASYPPGLGYPNVPTAWGSVDNNTKHEEGTRPFYEYDPVGYVTAEGDVTIYTWFYSILAEDNYNPIINGEYTKNASSSGPGKSPYFVTYEEGDTDPFREAFRNKIFSLRYTDRNGIVDTLTLHSYEFSYDGKELTYKTEEWFGDGSSKTVETFSSYEQVDANTAKYGDITFKVEGNRLLKSGDHIGTLGYTEEPDFLDRVKGANFENDSFAFSDNGRVVTVDGDEVYHYREGENKTSAVYEFIGSGFFNGYYYGFVIKNDSGKKDHKIVRTDGALWAGTVIFITSPQSGYRITGPLPPVTDSFLTSVANKTYSLRDTVNATVLHKYEFSSDGKRVTHNTRVWGENSDNHIKDYTGYIEGNMTTTGNYDDGIPFEVRGNDLYKNNVHVGTYNYNDPGVDELTITVEAKKLSNINWGSKVGLLNREQSYGGFSHSVRAAVYAEGEESKKNYTVLNHLEDGMQVAGDSSTWNIDKGDHLNLSGSTSGVYYDNKKNILIELDSIIRIHNFLGGFEGARLTKGSETSATHGNPIVTLKYNENTGNITVVGVTGGGVTAVYDQDFTVSKGESKDFTVTYGTGNKQTSVTYNIKVDEK